MLIYKDGEYVVDRVVICPESYIGKAKIQTAHYQISRGDLTLGWICLHAYQGRLELMRTNITYTPIECIERCIADAKRVLPA